MWLSLVEHYVRDVGAAGSNPVTSTMGKTVELAETTQFSRFLYFTEKVQTADLHPKIIKNHTSCHTKNEDNRAVGSGFYTLCTKPPKQKHALHNGCAFLLKKYEKSLNFAVFSLTRKKNVI